jgi:D-sorbitol dehydrogenase (acceptor)
VESFGSRVTFVVGKVGNMSSLDGRAVIVTGGASGIGLACAELVAERGADILLVDVDGDRLGSAAARLGVVAEQCDVGDPIATRDLVERCVQRFGHVDGLVNAAGVMQTRALLDVTPEDFDRIFRVNIRGLFFLLQAAARQMVTAGRGSIVNFSSTAGRVGRPFSSHYAASKAAIINLTRSAAAAFGDRGVRVNAVCPGLIETPMIQRIREERTKVMGVTQEEVQAHWESTLPMRRLGTPSEVAELVAFLLSDASSYITGEQIGATGGSDGS